MGLVFLIVIGAILGWLAAIIARTETVQGLLLNLAGGIGGALIAGLVVYPLIGGGSLLGGNYSVDGLLTALAGAVVLLVAVNLWRDDEELR